MKMNYLKGAIEKTLRDVPQSRDDDACLIFNVWQLMQDENDPPIPEYIYSLLRKFYPDSITRIRRMFQKEGMYPASEQKQKQRRHEQVVFAANLGAPNFLYPVWKEKDGRETHISKLHRSHLINISDYLENLGWSTESEKTTLEQWKVIIKNELTYRKKLDSGEIKL